LNAHPAASPDAWRPGFAKRAENFEQVCQTARSWRWQPGQYISRIMSAVVKGTPELPDRARSALVLYVDHLNQDRLETDQAYVWVSIGLTAEHLGCSEREMRRTNIILEQARFLIRDYNHANRPAGHEAINLAPLLARMEELEAVADALRQAARDRRTAYLESVLPDLAGQADKAVLLEQSQINASSSVTEMADAPSARSLESVRRDKPAESAERSVPNRQRQRQRNIQQGSSRGACFEGGGSSDTPAHLQRLRQELEAAIRVCPELAPCVSNRLIENPLEPTPDDVAKIIAAAEALLPDADRNNGQTALWGYQRHGARIVAMLAVALKDPTVKNPGRYFGKLATWDNSRSLDLRLNLARVLRSTGEVAYTPPAPGASPPKAAFATETIPATMIEPPPPLMAGPGADDPVWRCIDALLKLRVRTGAYGSWFARLGFHGIDDGDLHISTPNQISADHLKNNHLREILGAAEDAGHPISRIIITVRGGSGRPGRGK